jgi:hypothetical protein
MFDTVPTPKIYDDPIEIAALRDFTPPSDLIRAEIGGFLVVAFKSVVKWTELLAFTNLSLQTSDWQQGLSLARRKSEKINRVFSGNNFTRSCWVCVRPG